MPIPANIAQMDVNIQGFLKLKAPKNANGKAIFPQVLTTKFIARNKSLTISLEEVVSAHIDIPDINICKIATPVTSEPVNMFFVIRNDFIGIYFKLIHIPFI